MPIQTLHFQSLQFTLNPFSKICLVKQLCHLIKSFGFIDSRTFSANHHPFVFTFLFKHINNHSPWSQSFTRMLILSSTMSMYFPMNPTLTFKKLVSSQYLLECLITHKDDCATAQAFCKRWRLKISFLRWASNPWQCHQLSGSHIHVHPSTSTVLKHLMHWNIPYSQIFLRF